MPELLDPLRPASTHNSGPRHAVTVVLDPEDAPLLTTAGSWTPGDLVIRPTPRATGRSSLARDISAALGKNPFESVETRSVGAVPCVDHRPERPASDRGPRPPSTARTPTRPGSPGTDTASAPVAAVVELRPLRPCPGTSGQRTPHRRLSGTVPDRTGPPSHTPPPGRCPAPQPPWPRVPLSPCWTFLRDCRRMLAPTDFDRVLDEYRTAFTQTRQWSLHDRMSLMAWLRDTALGPLTDPWQALVWLRAIQSALLQRGLLLHWDPRPLGPDPTAALPSRLTPALCEALARRTRTDEGALVALALHLDQSPQFFELLTCESVRRDGSVVRVNRTRPSPLRPLTPGLGPVRNAVDHYQGTEYEEFVSAPIVLPPHARPFLAAQRAWRLACGARSKDPLFVHPDQPDHRCPEITLRSTLLSLAEELHLDLPWLHRAPCPQRPQLGREQIPRGWMSTRQLVLQSIGRRGRG